MKIVSYGTMTISGVSSTRECVFFKSTSFRHANNPNFLDYPEVGSNFFELLLPILISSVYAPWSFLSCAQISLIKAKENLWKVCKLCSIKDGGQPCMLRQLGTLSPYKTCSVCHIMLLIIADLPPAQHGLKRSQATTFYVGN